MSVKKVGISCCSNAHKPDVQPENETLRTILHDHGFEADFSKALYVDEKQHFPLGKERAAELMRLYQDERITDIFDVSGGDMGNETIPYIDFDLIEKSDKWFWGYSDLSTIINAIYTATGKPSVWYMVKNIVRDESGKQLSDFLASVDRKEGPLFDFPYRFVQGDYLEGIVVGGNIRCILKLAGTPYFPDVKNKILFLEGLGGEVPQMVTYLSQLEMLGAFDQIAGVLLGKFSIMEQNQCAPTIEELVLRYVGPEIPVMKTDRLGHGKNCKAVIIGKYYSFK